MRFLVDAQLPDRLADLLRAAGHDPVHTRQLPAGNATSDAEINRISMEEGRVVITKDTDFYNGYLIHGEPYKLLFVTTGNITNAQLEALFAANLPDLIRLLSQHEVIEISRHAIIVHV